jgi:hypothetical protein
VRRPLSVLTGLPSLLVAAALCGALFVPRLAPAQDNSATTGYAVRGTVVDAVSGQPIGRALVEINQQFAILTSGDGQFSFDNVSAGGYRVSIQKPGYMGIGQVMTSGGSGIPRQPSPPRYLTVGADMAPITFRLTPLAAITGHVTLSTADPADGIQVTAYTRRMENGRMRWASAGRARTRSDGSFRIGGLASGNYMVYTQPSLDQDRPQRKSSGPVWGYPAVYYPGVTDPSAAGMLTLRAGQQAQADISLVRQQFFEVTALVRSAEAANFQILDAGGRQTMLPASYDRRTQIVTASVPNGSWSLEAHSYGRDILWGRSDFQVAGAPVSVAISLLPIPHIPVNIRRDFVASADGSQPQTSGPGMNLFLVSADDFSMSGYGGGLNSVEGGNGQDWEIRVMEPGHYWVQATAFPPAYVSSLTTGGVDLAANPLVIVPGSTPAPIDITLRNDGGTITGTIAGQSPPAASSGVSTTQQTQAWVYAIPLFPSPANVPTGFVQPNGQFTISGLAPGSYRVIACDAPQEIDFHSPDGLAPWTAKGETVTVDAGGSAHVELTILSTGGAP